MVNQLNMMITISKLSLTQMIILHLTKFFFTTITIIIRSVTKKDDKYYPQLFLDDCLYEV